jgi:hypothetical protein
LADAHHLWAHLFHCRLTLPIPTNIAIERAAACFRYRNQLLENANVAIEAIIRPESNDSRHLFADFADSWQCSALRTLEC